LTVAPALKENEESKYKFTKIGGTAESKLFRPKYIRIEIALFD